MTIAVSGSHAGNGATSMKLDWSVSSFILENSIGCGFDQAVSEPNIGTRVLAENSE